MATKGAPTQEFWLVELIVGAVRFVIIGGQVCLFHCVVFCVEQPSYY